ncbi:MAG: hypothetical protein M3Y69_07085 [Verrucomicrobiota bacterium]|nr:hypothetical protein [Verrucomicrobiota bacterium]
MVALAAVVSLAVGALWWTITLRHERVAAVELIDGSENLHVRADGRADQLRSLPGPLQELVADALRTGRLQIPSDVVALKRKIPPKSALSVAQASPLRLLTPVGTCVADGHPQFRWTPQRDAAGYRVAVIATATNATVSSGDLSARQLDWAPDPALPAGETYRWEVEAFRDGEVLARSPAGTDGEARFCVLSSAQLGDFEELRRAAGNSRLAIGVAAASAGLLDEAAAEFYALAVQNPRSEIVRRLLEQLDANKR